MPKVTIYTQAYNPGAYLERCIESVLNQTYGDFEWLLIDHGSTDHTREVIQRYAERDKRIVPVYIDVNGSVPDIFFGTVRRYGTGKYLTHLDSDDWWDLDFLERLVPFAEENGLDLAMTGAMLQFENPDHSSGPSRILRKLSAPEVLTLEEFARRFSDVGPFAGALWGTLKVTEEFLTLEAEPNQIEIGKRRLNWRSDTLIMLSYVDHCRRIGINEYASYHYRKYIGSLSTQYSDSYFISNIYFFERLRDFFLRHGVLDSMDEYLHDRFFFEMHSTLGILEVSSLSADEKMRVCAQIISHPYTQESFAYSCPNRALWRDYIWNIASGALQDERLSDVQAARTVLGLLAPDCASGLTEAGLELAAKDRTFHALLLENDRDGLIQYLQSKLRGAQSPERLCAALQSLLPEDSPLRQVGDPSFFWNYPSLVRQLVKGKRTAALAQIARILEGEAPPQSETALRRLYLTLTAEGDTI